MNATVSALSFTSGDQTFRTDRFSYLLCGTAADAPFRCEGSRWELSEDCAAVELPELSLRVTRTMRACDGGAEESIEFYNYGEKKLRFSTIKLGWLLPLWELTLHAIPFTVQQDGWRHVYSAETLRCGKHFLHTRVCHLFYGSGILGHHKTLVLLRQRVSQNWVQNQSGSKHQTRRAGNKINRSFVFHRMLLFLSLRVIRFK